MPFASSSSASGYRLNFDAADAGLFHQVEFFGEPRVRGGGPNHHQRIMGRLSSGGVSNRCFRAAR